VYVKIFDSLVMCIWASLSVFVNSTFVLFLRLSSEDVIFIR
jgi:hypothetical protein